jgi:hypothetical protein
MASLNPSSRASQPPRPPFFAPHRCSPLHACAYWVSGFGFLVYQTVYAFPPQSFGPLASWRDRLAMAAPSPCPGRSRLSLLAYPDPPRLLRPRRLHAGGQRDVTLPRPCGRRAGLRAGYADRVQVSTAGRAVVDAAHDEPRVRRRRRRAPLLGIIIGPPDSWRLRSCHAASSAVQPFPCEQDGHSVQQTRHPPPPHVPQLKPRSPSLEYSVSARTHCTVQTHTHASRRVTTNPALEYSPSDPLRRTNTHTRLQACHHQPLPCIPSLGPDPLRRTKTHTRLQAGHHQHGRTHRDPGGGPHGLRGGRSGGPQDASVSPLRGCRCVYDGCRTLGAL